VIMGSSPIVRLMASVVVLVATAGAVPLSAQLGARPAEEWALTLESGRRMDALEINEVAAQIGLRPGELVADIGAGTGIFSVPLARAVSPGGRVLSVEVDAGFLPIIGSKARQAGLDNIQPVLGQYGDPRLPRGDVDAAFLHDVLHHIDERQSYIRALASYIKPGGRIVVVDYDMNVPGVPHGNQPEMLISPDQVAGWMSTAGLEQTREVGMFDDKFFVIYTKRR